MISIQMTTNELKVIRQSKIDMFKVLQVEREIYLPRIEQSNHQFIKQIGIREKMYVRIRYYCP